MSNDHRPGEAIDVRRYGERRLNAVLKRCARAGMAGAFTMLCISNLAGCGVKVDGERTEEELLVAVDAHLLEFRYVVLDWSAQSNQMLTGRSVPALDLTLFETDDGSTLADVPDFAERLAERMQTIFNDLEPADIVVLPVDDRSVLPTARVLMTQLLDETQPRRVGQAYFDPCDQRMGDEAVIWGQAMLDLGNGHSVDAWLNLFANTAAHEVAHTLGFNHPDVVGPEAGRTLPATELMLASHSLESLLEPQYFLIEQDTCQAESEPESIAYTIR